MLSDFIYDMSWYNNSRGLANVIVVNKYWIFNKSKNMYVPHYALLKNDLYTDYVVSSMVKTYKCSVIRFLSTENTILYTNLSNLTRDLKLKPQHIVTFCKDDQSDDDCLKNGKNHNQGNYENKYCKKGNVENVKSSASVSSSFNNNNGNCLNVNSVIKKTTSTCNSDNSTTISSCSNNVPLKKRKLDFSLVENKYNDGNSSCSSSSYVAATAAVDKEVKCKNAKITYEKADCKTVIRPFIPTLILFRQNYDVSNGTLYVRYL